VAAHVKRVKQADPGHDRDDVKSIIEMLIAGIKKHHGVTPVVGDTWYRDARLLIDHGPTGVEDANRPSYDEIIAVLKWTVESSWLMETGNLMSVRKFRQHYIKLRAEKKSNGTRRTGYRSPQFDELPARDAYTATI
jgi:hypothetical protein